MPKTKIRFEDLEQGLTAPIAITSNSVNAVSVDGNTFSVDALNNRIGIGINAPTANLHISGINGNLGSGNALFQLTDTTLGSIGVDNGNLANAFRIIAINTNIELQSTTNGNQLVLNTNGNVGIGTASPTAKLQVVGLTIHANNAAAISAGLTAGAFFHNGDGILRVVF